MDVFFLSCNDSGSYESLGVKTLKKKSVDKNQPNLSLSNLICQISKRALDRSEKYNYFSQSSLTPL